MCSRRRARRSRPSGSREVSTSAEEAFALKIPARRGFDSCMNADRLLHAAKTTALALARRGYQPPDPVREIPVAGEGGIAAIKASLYNMREGPLHLRLR